MIIVRHKKLKKVVAVFDCSHTILDASDSIQLSELDCFDFEYQESPHKGAFVYSAPGFNISSRDMAISVGLASSELRDWHDLPCLDFHECKGAEYDAARKARQAEKDLF